MKISSPNKNLKILVIGFGSIGQRHYRNLHTLGFRNIFVYDTDPTKTAGKKLKVLTQVGTSDLRDFKMVLVCNLNNMHVKTALRCVWAGCDIFIEKPLSNNLTGVEELIRLCKAKRLVNMVACNMRFHPCIQFIKKYIDGGRLGKIYSMAFEGAYYLPYWRPGQDYRQNYAAKKETGGGIILDGIHEFDLLFWFNGYEPVLDSKFLYGKISNLEIGTEDICIASFKFRNRVLGLVKCDYLQKSYSRNCKIVGEKGNLEWDFQENAVWLKSKNKLQRLFAAKNYDTNKFYLEELKYFLECVANREQTFNDVKIASKTLELCLKR